MGGKLRKLKILHTIRQGKIGGGETHMLDLVSQLSPLHYESEVIAFTDGEMLEALEAKGIPCTVIPTEKPFDIGVWPKLRKYIEDRAIDLVHAHGTRACSNSFWAARKQAVPLVYTIHGWSFHPDQNHLIWQFRKMGEKLLVNRADVNIAVSKSNQRDGIEKLGMPRSLVIPNAVDLQKFNPKLPQDLSRKELGIPAGKVVVGMLARLTHQKDPIGFIQAAAEVLKKTKSVYFLMVGGGELYEFCRQEVRRLGIDEHIGFEAFRTDVPAVLKLIDVYCLPSLWEGLPIGVLEAMAMEKAVVATPVDGTRELIQDGSTGILAPQGDYRQWADQILHLVSNINERKRLGENARRMVQENYSIEKMSAAVQEVYQQLCLSELAER